VVVAEIVVRRSWQRPLYGTSRRHRRRTLHRHAGIAITGIPFHLR
jgi:hypothetical protein